MHWICSQIGAREHYAIPRVLHRMGKLDSLYTDLWATPFWRNAGDLVGRRVLATRYHSDLETACVKSFNLATLVDSAMGGGAHMNPYDWFVNVGADFSRSVQASLQRRKSLNWPEFIFFSYDTGFLEAASWVRSRGGKGVVCQMDPSRFEAEIVVEEEKQWPGWAKRSITIPDGFFSRREEEWATANLVLVNSEWSQQALIKQGVDEKKIVVVPLAYEVEKSRAESRESTNAASMSSGKSTLEKLHVLFLGQVILRKGIQYLIEAARLLQHERIHIDVVGPIGISDQIVKSAPGNMSFHGAISRDKAPDFFRKADLFILPTLSDGFALTQIEAMAYGLPVITTANCGVVVSNGVDGFIVKTRDVGGLADAVRTFLDDPELLERMGEAAKIKAVQFSLERLEDNLIKVEERLK